MNPEVKELINSLAKEMNLKIADVEKVYNAPFELQAIVMKYRCDREKQYFPSLRIPYLLVFYCPEWNKERLRRKYGNKKKDETVRST